RALAAQIQWELAVVANTSGDYDAGVRYAEAAGTAFRTLGESSNAAFVDGVAAHSYDMIGASDLAWSRRARTFAALEANRPRLGATLHDAAKTLAAFGRDEAAEALVDTAIEYEREDPAQLAT